MEDEEYFAKLQAYNDALAALSPEDKKDYFREDYTEVEYDWPEYLDYCDDWKYNYTAIARRHFNNFVVELAKRKTKLICQGHHHEMRYHHREDDISSTVLDGPMIVLSDTTIIPATCCWRKTILDAIEETAEGTNNHWIVAQLPLPMINIFKALVQTGLAQENQTYELIPFDIFSAGLWDKGPQSALNALKDRSKTVKNLVSQLEKTREETVEDKLLNSKQNEIIYDSESVITDHGFHTFLDASNQTFRWLNKINRIRGKASNYSLSQNIRHKDIEKARTKCEQCIKRPGKRSLSVPGIYYAPPGSGKTTCATNESFVGLDTDWLTSKLHWSQISDFLFENVPIITNQIHAFHNSGMLITGSVVIEHIRKNTRGKPFTTEKELKEAKAVHRHTILKIRKESNTYLERSLLQMYFIQYIRNETLRIFMKRRAPVITEYWKDDRRPKFKMKKEDAFAQFVPAKV